MDKIDSKHSGLTRKKVTLYSLLLMGAVILCVLIWQLFLYINPQARVDFTVYKPQKLPAGLSIKDTSIDIWSNRLWLGTGIGIDSPFPYAVDVTQYLSKQDSFITQEKSKNFDYTCPTKQALSTCQVQTTKNGQKYTLAINTYSQPSILAEEYAEFLKGDTHVTIRVSTDTNHLLLVNDWSDTIDSFAPTTLSGVKANYYHPGP